MHVFIVEICKEYDDDDWLSDFESCELQLDNFE